MSLARNRFVRLILPGMGFLLLSGQQLCIEPPVRQSCKDILLNGEGTADGVYTIDPDGDGGIDPFEVFCDMTIDGGGWTRFNWLHQRYPAGEDPLAQNLWECDVEATICRGTIPPGVEPNDLLVKGRTSGEHAAWHFNESTISNALVGALRDRREYCGAQQGAFMPYLNTSTEGFCGTGQEGGCDSFYYTSGTCRSVGNFGMNWDGDNAWCASVFKMGATFGGSCGAGDQGFLNDCDCNDEEGELYYR